MLRTSPLLLAVGCHALGTLPAPADSPADTAEERIVVSPARLDFGEVSVNAQGSTARTFTVYNLSDEPVTISGQDEVLGSEVFGVDTEALLTLAGGEARVFLARFTPPTEGAWEGRMIVEPGSELIELAGSATAPVAEVLEVVMDPVVLGCTGTGVVRLRNVGSERLTLTDARVGGAEYAVLDVPPALEPGWTEDLAISFTPAGGGMRGDTLLVDTNDPVQPTLAVPLSTLGYEGEQVTESFRYTPSNPTDILFVVDMGGAAAEVDPTQAVSAWVDTIRDTNTDYQVLALPSDQLCDTGGWATRTDSAPQTEAVLLRGFAGDGGAWDDDLTGLALAAVGEAEAGGCLDGFRRAEADLHVIAITDGPSHGGVAADVDTLAAAVDRDASFRLSALVPEGGCAPPLNDYVNASRTTGGVDADLCASDWTNTFLQLAELPPGAEAVHYPLQDEPVPSTIEVHVEGQPFTLWSYDPAANEVVFDGAAVPALGAEVTIAYVSAVACTGQ